MIIETLKGYFWQAETRNGTDFFPCEYFTREHVQDMLNCKPEDIERVKGWFARLSMPGYLDCTEWNGPFETATEARTYVSELYGDDNGEDA